ncbi:unnamed protein product [Brassicogethes aeneus]|uniref:Uncharacterized protein n=1 Tax=Brassicogethes aeneus TaxID=1431903 RepID=A0A9P0BGA6_BRAAE|nr:unnamed protein product [Brassicogethes aeneus]
MDYESEEPATDDDDNNDPLVEVEREPYFSSNLAAKRIKKRKMMPGEKSNDECIADPEKIFETQVYNVIYHNALQSLENRFTGHQTLFLNLAWLDPSFGKIDDLPHGSFQYIADQITKHSGNNIVTSAEIYSELKDFAKK